ncbi:MAG: protoheme IX farnesyltransferase [Verrucomicrobia bacterium]|nr:protoheme IX farnesyltransferase [Verrucomicrobiota bacterium]MBV9674440.1 protoheme IX farnesyltransferase [Verrucomicrobiota bacterium]
MPGQVTQPRRWVSDLSILVKARLSFLVLVTTLVGFLFGWRGQLNIVDLFNTLFGTALAAAGAAALNQVFEVELDALMRRTRNRPLPGGRMTLEEALLIGVTCSVTGIIWLSLTTNLYAGMLSALTTGIYLFVYTPLKTRTSLNTIVGAIPGALPPVIGWTAARGHADFESWILFAILFLWQMPHFLAISWLYRDEYKKAGFVMLSGTDPGCRMTGRQSLLYTMVLTCVSFIPVLLQLTTVWYFPVAALMGGYFLWNSFRFAIEGSAIAARQLFLSSIIYLPVTLVALVLTRS